GGDVAELLGDVVGLGVQLEILLAEAGQGIDQAVFGQVIAAVDDDFGEAEVAGLETDDVACGEDPGLDLVVAVAVVASGLEVEEFGVERATVQHEPEELRAGGFMADVHTITLSKIVWEVL